MSRVAGRITLSIRLNHFPPLTPFPSADTMRSVQIVASAHHKSRGCPPVASLPCLAVTALPGLSCSIPNLSHPASCLPSLETSFPAPSTARSGLGSTKALTPDDLTQTARSLRLRRLAVPTFRPQPRDPPNGRFEYQPPSAPEVVPGFAIHEQARHKTPPKQVRHPTDCQFTSSCSPPVGPSLAVQPRRRSYLRFLGCDQPGPGLAPGHDVTLAPGGYVNLNGGWYYWQHHVGAAGPGPTRRLCV